MQRRKKNTEPEVDGAEQEQVDLLKDAAVEEEAPVEALPVQGDERSEEEAEDPYLFEEGGDGEAEPAPDESGEEEVEEEVEEDLTSLSDLALPELEPDVEGGERGEPDAILLAPAPSIQGERLARAKEAVEGGEVEKAIGIYLDVIRENPANIKARNNLGVLYDEMGSHELALEQLEAARELDPENQEILTNLGAVLGAMGQYDEAERELRRALRLDPENVDIHANLGILHFRRGLYGEAEAALEWVCERDPDHGPSFSYRGEALNRLGRVEEAVEVLKRAVELQPTNAKAYYTLGILFDKKRLPEEAAALYRKARELSS